MEGGILRGIDAGGALLVGLFVAHFFADFLVQTEHVARKKGRSHGALLVHGLLTLLTGFVVLAPFWGPRLLAGIVLLTLVHLLIDRAKPKDPGRRHPVALFFVDQGLHGISIVLAWYGMVWSGALADAWFSPPPAALETGARIAVVAAGYVFNGKGGTAIVRRILDVYPEVIPAADGGESPAYAMGRTIGILERLLAYTLVLLDQWGALGLVLAAKSIARFRELEDQRFADYYLIGTLTSLTVAVATGIVVRGILG